jgi:hypothetical protein
MTPASKQQIAHAMSFDVRASSVTHRLQFAKGLSMMCRLQAQINRFDIQFPIAINGNFAAHRDRSLKGRQAVPGR